MLRFRASFLFLFSLLAIWGSDLTAQIYDPMDWSFEIYDEGDGSYEVVFTSELEAGWHVYSQDLSSDEGPLPSEFVFEGNDQYSLSGKVQECEPHTEYDPNFMMDLEYFEGKTNWWQKLKITDKALKEIKGYISFMVCDASKCLPPEYFDFVIDVTKAKKKPSGFEYCPKASTSHSEKQTQKEQEVEAIEDQGDNLELETPTGENEPQIYDPMDWSYQVFAQASGEYEIVFTSTLEEGWHVYSQNLSSNEGPLPTEIVFEDTTKVIADTKFNECVAHKEFDSTFNMELEWFEGTSNFWNVVKVKDAGLSKLKGYISFMVCNDEMCLPPEYFDFDIDLSTAVEKPSNFEYCGTQSLHSNDAGNEDTLSNDGTDAENSNDPLMNKSLLGLFIAGFLFGFVALMTPCVFPMIPMTVSFFTKQSKTKSEGVRNALFYGLFIIVIYTGLGILLVVLFGASALNELSTAPIFNFFLFILLLIFGVSFLGAFEIQLPTSWANKMDRASDKGGMIGIFFMAATLAIVTFSCTGPLIGGALAAASQGGNYLGPAAVMFGFSLALSLPFMLFAAFPGWLNSLPKSGGWLNSVKVVLGLLEIGFAMKFLSNADLVLQLGLLKREMFIAIWIAVGLVITLYLFGKLRFPHDSPFERLSVTRFMFGLGFLVMTIYLVPGIWGAPLKLISGFPPPMFYSESAGLMSSGGGDGHDSGGHVEAHYRDYDEAMAVAKAEGKPLLVDFTGWACVNCRRMEEQVWPDATVRELMMEKVVLVSLYVDDREKLPEEEQHVEILSGKEFKVRTIGDKWSYMQAEKYKTNAQPYYVMLDHEGNQLGGHAAYNSDPQIFIDFLEHGLDLFKKK